MKCKIFIDSNENEINEFLKHVKVYHVAMSDSAYRDFKILILYKEEKK